MGRKFIRELHGLTTHVKKRVTLHAYLVDVEGVKCIKELKDLATRIYRQVADMDILQAYPSGEIIANISKETTWIELLDIAGIPEESRRRAGINMTGGATNAIEVANDLFGLPDLMEALNKFEKDKADELTEASD